MRVLQTGHEELVHAVAYDYYGRHVATASLDQHVKVFDLDAATGAWVLNDLWKAHDLLVVKVLWAHPELASSRVLALCLYDRTVRLWQETDEMHGSGRRWRRLATLAMELHGPIYDVLFAPPHTGLQVACVGSDGIVRVYSNQQPSLAHWVLLAEAAVLTLQVPARSLQSSFAVEWCPAKFARTMFAVVALDQAFVYGLSDSAADDDDVTARYVRLCSLPNHNGLVRLVSWAPLMGRSHHLIATACKDGCVRVFEGREENGFQVHLAATLADHALEVWRVLWNATGTILSSAGDDGRVLLWKQNYMREWRCMSEVTTSEKPA